MKAVQLLTIGTIAGPKKLKAPGGWKFNDTDITVWSWLLEYTRDRNGKLKTKRDAIVLDAQIKALAIVLSNSLGNASTYWANQAEWFA